MSEPPLEQRATQAAPSSLRVAWLVIELEGRRRWNQAEVVWQRRKTRGPRVGTARKGAPAKLLLALISVIFLFNTTDFITRLVHRTALEAERSEQPADGTVLVSRETFEGIDWLARRDPARVAGELDTHAQRVDMFYQALLDDDSFSDRHARAVRAEQLTLLYEQRGPAGFRASKVDPRSLFPSTQLWYHSQDPWLMLRPLGVACFLLCLGVMLLSAVGTGRDLARTESTLEWWFTFPVSARGLLFARVLGSAVVNPLLWLLVMPFFSIVFWCSGLGPWLGLSLGLPAALSIGLFAGSLRVLCETSLRRLMPLRRVAHAQAALELLGVIALLLALATAMSKPGLSYVLAYARGLASWTLYNPLTLPLCWRLGPTSVLATGPLAAAYVALAVSLSVALGSHWLRDGLIASPGPLLGPRGLRTADLPPREGTRASTDPREPRSLLVVIAQKELLSITRDPGRLTRVLIFPLFMIGFNGLLNPDFFRAIVTSPAHASAAAFGIGSLVLVGGGLLALANEGAGLWLLYTAPWSIEKVLLHKATFWAGFASAVTLLALIALAAVAQEPYFVLSPYALLAVVGVSLYGLIAVGLGALGTDVLESERQRRMQPLTSQLFLLLTAMFMFALYTPSAWAKFAQLSLSSLFAFALWQKLRDHAPYFLDPTEAPPPRIAVADGVFAALAFFVLQGLLGLLFRRLGLSPGLTLVFAFVGAGLLVTAGALYAFRRMGVPELLTVLGLKGVHTKPLQAVFLGLVAGIIGGAIAVAYAQTIQQIDWLRELYEETERLDPSPRLLPWLYALAVFAAPLFEELIFRGVLFRGFRRSLGPLPAALASALVFALVHPPLSFVPVFVLALLAAAVFERSQLLLAPIIAHMTYNAIVVGLAIAAH